MSKFFKTPFAASGDKIIIPDAMTPDGSVNYTEGWSLDYERPLDTDVHAKPVGRKEMNGVLHDITAALRVHQSQAYPDYINAADNGGAQYPYAKGVAVRFNGEFYVSLADANTALPTDGTKWQPIIFQRATQDEVDNGIGDYLVVTPPMLKKYLRDSIDDTTNEIKPFLFPAGAVVAWGSETPPDGWLECNGQGFDTSKFPQLRAVYPSGRVPDLRGYAIRGWAHGSYADEANWRSILSVQRDAMNGERHKPGNNDGGIDSGGSAGPGTKPLAISLDSGAVATISMAPFGGLGPGGGGNPLTYTETRMKNVAMMYIVKTDEAEEIAPAPTPNNIVVSPSSLSVGVGTTQQFTGQVMPAELAGQYPITWMSSDTSVGTIDANGLFRALAAGNTDIIATLSTGLSVRVTVTVNVLLTSITLAAIPDQVVGNTYELVVSKVPSNATEAILFDSTDNAIASVTTDGKLFTSGTGQATITVTGAVSGKTVSRTVKVAAAPPVDQYLVIKNNLSEIKKAGEVSQQAARDNLALGKLATKDSLSSGDVGAFPVSGSALAAGVNLNTLVKNGQYFQTISSNAATVLNYPELVAGVLRVYETGIDGGCRQVYMPYNSTVEYRRYAFGNPLKFYEWKAY
ncbi:Ig-like domain-containing protein [Pluralibacter gergoviae]|uniref:Ig-like domain-containing protein n=1 Tax=Pluralibacter gergoviae TaxID=61647 RepID=A0AAI9DKU0_PLUGE|nr:Ig-like domain-containing protein [Pluralibacter gergoviae]EKV9907702.1 Ig-like domain-containing protein [Pluralibacter gergoviae]ELD4293966.1 Ig-like domain-containing protein [Pluralibacter gergoviae]ELD4304745.1 Ig-like domain-containing protein [Pluralibacter gergoviae]ELD4330308.1 Ig-like domain-containing protein [Pluralibacter gergoviae]